MDNGFYFWSIIAFMIAGTICIRGSIIAVSSRFKITDRLRRLFTFFPAAIFPAFIVPAAFFHNGQSHIAHGKERLAILVVAGLVSLWSRSTVATIAVGLIALYFVSQYF